MPLLFVFTGCTGGGGGNGEDELRLLSGHLSSGPTLPATTQAFLNDHLILTFSAPIDHATVDEDSVQIRREDGGFSIPADGVFAVSESRITFAPDLPRRPDLSDAGFAPGTTYRIEIPATGARSLRSKQGQGLTESVTLIFETRDKGPFLFDQVEGSPRLVGLAFDLDGDGNISSDGDPQTVDPEEFLNIEERPILEGVPLGLVRSPQRIAVLFSEPLIPESVLRDRDEDGFLDAITLFDPLDNRKLRFRPELRQGFNPETERFFAILELIPKTSLPAGTMIEVKVGVGLVDFAQSPRPLLPKTLLFGTRFGPASFEDEFEEDFHTREEVDGKTTAEWNIENSNLLVSGKGIGGTGIDGPLILNRSQVIRLNTDENGGVFQFTEVEIARGAQVYVEGANPLRLFATGDVCLGGTIHAQGQAGEPGTTLRGRESVRGGAGGPAGSKGGQARVDMRPQRAGDGGEPPGTDGGGQGGARSAETPGGGGGGGHETDGETDPGGIFTSGQGGRRYGDEDITVLYGGSGGGAGGTGAVSDNLFDDNLGGGGGGGGGAVLISTAGTFFLDGGRINVNGGNGGDGGRPGLALDPGGGGGGGGSGGSIKIEALRSAEIFFGSLSHFGGLGGQSGGRGARDGAKGAAGRLRLFLLRANRKGSGVGRSIALSRYLDTGSRNPRFSFDASDPLTGEIIVTEDTKNIELIGEIPPTATAFIFFQGTDAASEDPSQPSHSNPSSWKTRIEDLNGYRFIRFRIEFDIGLEIEVNPRVIVSKLRISFQFDV